ncbi:unnamed protein product [Rotaria socialis]|uniref:RBR-type E3 ubiquitin transferase n=1 Tax=Rotaria socialis TaxID=392032 RepID=A0A820KZJ4_9BILA|nr:unnamed protein product [Rotaria socialis]CAF3328448.1 unnamed protein product [Rotaria socialis]CAF3328638.1 unnamed protein product [Rotaria socialis]CAF3471107.1 unnamed protein product [Rotaria socialis]CAF4144824.1 unnamed protein product [Rotaria socialis]
MSECTTTTTNVTTTIRSVTDEVPSLIASNENKNFNSEKNSNSSQKELRERRSSSSSFASDSSSSDSITTFTINQNKDDDDASSNDDTNLDWANLQQRLHTLRRLMPSISLSSSDDGSGVVLPTAECQVCLEESSIRPLSCCSSTVCSSCIYSHLSSHISEAQIRIACPSCPHILTREEILLLLLEKDTNGEIAERYKRFYADINREPHIKTCPQCCAIKQIDKNLFQGVRLRKNIPRRVTCDECQFEWCFYCHAPWHSKMTCKEYREGEKLLRVWAAKTDNNQQNAQRCPRCKVFISRNGGCPHMICSKCHCDFCYNCGKKRMGFKFLGSHESRYSPFGCKYNLYPDKPILRYTVRGLIAGAATLAAPVAAVGAVALLAVGTTIGAPTYGTYRLVKHIRNRRRARHLRSQSTPSTLSEDNPNDTEDDDFIRAVEASLLTFKEEMEKREDSPRNHIDESDSDSLDVYSTHDQQSAD